jgi:hypothetical protein
MLRKWITPLTTGAFVLVGITGLLMFFNVRIELVTRAHEWLSPVFVVASLLHVWLNWGAMKAHLKRPLGVGIVAGFALLTLAALVLPIGHGKSGGHGEAELIARSVQPSLLHARVGLLAELAQIEPAEAIRRLEAVGLHGIADTSRLDDASRSGQVPSSKALVALFPAKGESKD